MNGEKNNGEGFGVPGGYFGRSAASIRNRIEWEGEHADFPVLLQSRKGDVFDVPAGYFAGNAARLENIPYPQLVSAGMKSGFVVPDNYFADKSRLLKKSGNKKSAIIISLFRSRFAVAAALVAVLAGAWIYQVYFRNAGNECKGIACVDRYDVARSKSIEMFDNDELYEMVDPQKLEKNLRGKEKNNRYDSIRVEDVLDDI